MSTYVRSSTAFASSDKVVVIGSEPHMVRTCKTSLVFASLAIQVLVGYSCSSVLQSDITIIMIKTF